MVCQYSTMTAPFARDLCGYRPDGDRVANTADAHDANSRRWGQGLLEALGVPDNDVGRENDKMGAPFEVAVRNHLSSLETGLRFAGAPASEFEQYLHLATFMRFQKDYKASVTHLEEAQLALADLPPSRARKHLATLLRRAKAHRDHNEALVEGLRRTMPEESLLNVDIAAWNPLESVPRLRIALSLKWSLRTDRAQDGISQGQKLSSLRRGQMPHYAVLTMEPRPSMLKLLAYGSGAVDCVYHAALPELRAAAERRVAIEGHRQIKQQQELLELMVEQRRLRDYDELVEEVLRHRA